MDIIDHAKIAERLHNFPTTCQSCSKLLVHENYARESGVLKVTFKKLLKVKSGYKHRSSSEWIFLTWTLDLQHCSSVK